MSQQQYVDAYIYHVGVQIVSLFIVLQTYTILLQIS